MFVRGMSAAGDWLKRQTEDEKRDPGAVGHGPLRRRGQSSSRVVLLAEARPARVSLGWWIRSYFGSEPWRSQERKPEGVQGHS
jgi:hypothetical protein